MVRERPAGPRRIRNEPIVLHQLRAQKIDVPGERGERHVWRVAEARGAEREDLPPGLLRRREGIDPWVGLRTEGADGERAGEAGRVNNNSGRTLHVGVLSSESD